MGTDLKTLKKRMSKSFKNLLSALDDGKLPKLDLVAGWCDDADLMAKLLSQGREHFPPFQKKCRELLDAVEQGRLVAARDAVADLNRMRKDCHSRYK